MHSPHKGYMFMELEAGNQGHLKLKDSLNKHIGLSRSKYS